MENWLENTVSQIKFEVDYFRKVTNEVWSPRIAERTIRVIIKERYPMIRNQILADILGAGRMSLEKTIRDWHDERFHEQGAKKAYESGLQIIRNAYQKGELGDRSHQESDGEQDLS